MNCIKKHIIDRLAQNIKQETPVDTDHLFHCEKCRTLYLELVEFYNYYPQTQGSRLPDNFRHTLIGQQGPIIEFKPMKTEHAHTAQPYRLAAKGGQPIDNYTVFSFSNEKEEIVARVMYDQISGEIMVYLIAEDPAKIAHRKIKLLPTMLEGITDKNGFVHLGQKKEFECTDLQIKLSLASFNLSPHIMKQKDVDSG
ncbi:hypothetical protein JW935_06320 [candidate division KSB1 bacterium]|nr:hypothetical protein [candidate division KSB1 bacterium]